MGAGSDADARVGVFVCHCGHNIAGRVRVPELVEAMEGAVYAGDYPYMCSDPGQRMLREVIRDHELDAVVVAACSPRLHERTFQRAVHAAGPINPSPLGPKDKNQHERTKPCRSKDQTKPSPPPISPSGSTSYQSPPDAVAQCRSAPDCAS